MKRIFSAVLSVVVMVSMFACLTAVTTVPVVAATQSQLNIVERADFMYDTLWYCQRDMYSWNNSRIFQAGTYYRIPYGQPSVQGCYVGFNGVTVNTFLQQSTNPNGVFYTGRSKNGSGVVAPYYSTDCSAFVSYCWGTTRHTTYSIPFISTNLGYATAANNYNLQLGDALNSNSAGHVVLVTGLTYSNGTLVEIEITEQTPPQLKRSYYTPQSLGAKYGSQYTIQRYYGNVPKDPEASNAPQGMFEEASGGVGSVSVKGWAFDKDDLAKALEIHVYVGGEAGVGENHVIYANQLRQDVNNAYGAGNYHGFDTTVGTTKTGQQPVYVYAIDNDGRKGNVLLGSATVTITADTEKPTVGEAKLVSSDGNGFKVSAKVSDNGVVDSVRFAVTTSAEQTGDSFKWYDGTVSGNTATCTIPVSDFNNHNGTYYVHVYAYDGVGNYDGNGDGEITFHNPIGSVDAVTDAKGAVTVRGWAYDGDNPDQSIDVHVYVGGEPGVGEHHVIKADQLREDVDSAYGYGKNHGYEATFSTSFKGNVPVYVYGINVGNGGNAYIGTKNATVTADDQIPTITDAKITTGETGYTVTCKVSDDKMIGRVQFPTTVDATMSAASFKWYTGTVQNGVASVTIPFADFGNYEGTYYTHIYAYDAYDNYASCSLETTHYAPKANCEEVRDAEGAVYVKGWVYDADDMTASTDIHVCIGGEPGVGEQHVIKADKERTDVDAVYGCGTNHGFEETLQTNLRGEQTVYIYAINVGNGSNQYIGSQTITITAAPDNELPIITNAQVIEGENGYTVTCQVSDNVGITEVKFPTSIDTDPNNFTWYVGTVQDGIASFTVPFADFGGYEGTYNTHIYAYDAKGNFAAYPVQTTHHKPETYLDEIKGGQGEVYVKGWAYDEDALGEALDIHVYIGGEPGVGEQHVIQANTARPDVDGAYGCGANHGYETTVQTALRGEQVVYVYAISAGNGSNVYIGSQTVTIEEPAAFVSGDADGNGTVNEDDLTALSQYLVGGWSVSINIHAADVNGDGKVTNKDAVILNRYLNGWDITLG